jgi:hypothetical protein
MVGPAAVTATALEAETGIPQPTLSRWLRGAASIKVVPMTPEGPVEAKRPQDWTPMERAQLVLEASGLSDEALGELLRRRGVHREQLDEWRAALEAAFAPPSAKPSGDAKRIRELEREVARKDKALAETTALLVLQKNGRERRPKLREGSACRPETPCRSVALRSRSGRQVFGASSP